jgi:hypothetical protein
LDIGSFLDQALKRYLYFRCRGILQFSDTPPDVHGTPIVVTCQSRGSQSPLCGKIFFARVLSPTGANNGEA